MCGEQDSKCVGGEWVGVGGERVSNECVGGKVMWGTAGEYDE